MENKNLPIKLFKKRDDIDDRRTEGGGNRELPSWLLTREELAERSALFINTLRETRSVLESRNKERSFIPAVIKVSLQEKALAKAHRAEVGKIFNSGHKYNFIGMSDEYDLLVKVDSIQDLDLISRNIADINKHAHGLSSIEDLQAFSPLIEETDEVLKVKLINFQNYNINKSIEALFAEHLTSHNVTFKKTRYAADLTVFKIGKVGHDVLEDIKAFEAVYSITPMPHFNIGMDAFHADKIIPIREPKAEEEYPIVGVLDSGIAPIPHLKPWLTEDSFSKYPVELTDPSHGTFVAGVILYGDDLQDANWTGFQGCKLFSATVFPDLTKETIDEDELTENIAEAITQNPHIKIWNFSGGAVQECDLHDFSDFGKFLDDLQDKYNVLICKSAGNCTNFVSRRPTLRIPKSADSIRSLVVASIAHTKGEHDQAEVNWPSPFSRAGFGPNNLIKPDLSHYGGNAGVLPSGRMTTSGVCSFSTSGHTVSNVGTSFSTPRITSILAGINHKLKEEFNPLLLKALLIHSAKHPENVTLTQTEKMRQLGFGVPSKIDDILYNSPNEITLILQDTLTRGSYYEILDFPFPTDMVENGQFYGEITITLVNSPLLDNSSAIEYCQSNIDVSFGTYDRVKERDTSKRTVINEYGTDGGINLLNESKYSKKHINNPLSPFANERLLRNYGKKFHPIKKYSINLDELTPTSQLKALVAPKKWFLRLEGLYSAFAEARAAIDGTELSQEFCLVVTIRDTRNKRLVYDSVTRQLDSYNFIHQNIQIRNEVQVRLQG